MEVWTNCNDEEIGVPCDITWPSSVCTVDTIAAQYSLWICGSELRHVQWKKSICVKCLPRLFFTEGSVSGVLSVFTFTSNGNVQSGRE